MSMAANDNLPRHVAVIMDGNGRWARKRALPRHVGHRSGVGAVRKIVELAAKRGVEYLTLFAFSSENWSRPRDEVSRLMGLFVEALQREVDELHRNNVRLEFIGARQQLQAGLIDKISAAEEQTRGNDGLRLIVAVAYGGRWDIVRPFASWRATWPPGISRSKKSMTRRLQRSCSCAAFRIRTY